MTSGNEHFYDATQACWMALFRRLHRAPAPQSTLARARALWNAACGRAEDPLEPPLGDPARNLYTTEASRCTRCGVKFMPRPVGSHHPPTWRVCRSCARHAAETARGRRGIRLVPAPATDAGAGALP
jgi:hypothetical protein